MKDYDLWSLHPEWWNHPDWENTGKVHDWRNYISDELREIWNTFTQEQKIRIALNADWQAGLEEWD